MKKIVFVFILMLAVGSVFSQTKHNRGVIVGNVAASNAVDSLTHDGSLYKLYDGSTQLAPSIPAGASTELSAISPLLTDAVTKYLFGSGVGLAGDTTLIDASLNGYGYFRMDEDSLEITKLITNIPAGDSVNFSVVYNDTLWASAVCDTIVTVNAGAGETITTSFTVDTIPEDYYIWIEMDAVVLTRKPVKFRVELVGYIKRD